MYCTLLFVTVECISYGIVELQFNTLYAVLSTQIEACSGNISEIEELVYIRLNMRRLVDKR